MNLAVFLDFSPDSVAQTCFFLPPEPPSALGSTWDCHAKKWAEPADFGVLGARLVVFSADVKKIALGGMLGA